MRLLSLPRLWRLLRQAETSHAPQTHALSARTSAADIHRTTSANTKKEETSEAQAVGGGCTGGALDMGPRPRGAGGAFSLSLAALFGSLKIALHDMQPVAVELQAVPRLQSRIMLPDNQKRNNSWYALFHAPFIRALFDPFN